jgi:hypothetical protein
VSDRGFRNRILEVIEDGSALANSTTPTNLLPASALEAAFGIGYWERGKVLAFDFSGRISTVVTTPGTLALALRLGTVDVFASGAMTLNTTAQTNVHWRLSGELVCRAAGSGSATTFMPKGCRFESHAVIGSPAPTAGGAGAHMLPYNAAPAVGSGLDFTGDQKLTLMATWSVANASNSIQLHAGHADVYIGG